MMQTEMILNGIGCDCFYKAVASIMAYNGELENMFSFVGYDFIYEHQAYLEFSLSMQPQDYFKNYGLLYFEHDPNSTCSNDYLRHVHDRLKGRRSLFQRIIDLSQQGGIDSKEILAYTIHLLEEKKNIAIMLDPYPMREVYKFKGARCSSYPSEHYVVLFGYDKQNQTFLVVDNYFMFCGCIPTGLLLKAIDSLLELGKTINMFTIIKSEEPIENKYELLLWSLREYMEDSLRINDRTYLKNTTAINALYNDWDDQITYACEKFNEFAPQFLSYPYKDFRHQLNGLRSLVDMVFPNDIRLAALSKALSKYSKQWKLFDMKLDLIAVKQEKITDQRSELKNCLTRIIETEATFMAQVMKLLDGNVKHV